MRAIDTFRTQPWCHNCAQAVANKWCELYTHPATILDELALSAAGRAEGGVCGALYAAQLALPQYKEEISAEFAKRVGDIRCFDIKRNGKTSCPTCVDIADKLVEEFSRK